MARPTRPQVAGGVYHLTARSQGRGLLFCDDADRHAYLRCIRRAWSRTGARFLSYCLMSNHVHLVVETPDPVLATTMQLVGGSYARRFNARHRRTGHVFESRYHDVVITDDRQLATALSYVALNPVRAGICDRPGDWRWSAHAALLGHVPSPDFLATRRTLELLGGGPKNYAAMFA